MDRDNSRSPESQENLHSSKNSRASNVRNANSSDGEGTQQKGFHPPQITLPKGGGAIQGIGEKFQVNPVTGTGSMSIPITISQGRGGFGPQLALSYDSGAGNSVFGLGWNIGLPSISRKTQKGLPQYEGLPQYYDDWEGDVFLLSGYEDLVPLLNSNGEKFVDNLTHPDFTIYRYIPRIEGQFAKIEKWVNDTDGNIHWRSITKENITSLYGQSSFSRIADPANSHKVFQWKIEKSWDDKGNIILYEYKQEDGVGLAPKPIYEKNRDASNAYAQTYLKRVLYGNTIPHNSPDFANNQWLFELVLDYGEHFRSGDIIPSYIAQYDWLSRPDSFSSFRSGFEIRTYRLCRKILMFHHFTNELGVDNYLVKATHLGLDENPIATQLHSVTHTGYKLGINNQYQQKSFPPVNFTYTEHKIDEKIYHIHSEDLSNVPQGLDGQEYQFIDLYGEGLSGILKQNSTAWYYKYNLGGGNFGPMELVTEVPSLAINSQLQIADFGGDGLTDAIVQNGILNGYFELDEDAQWSQFKPFSHPVNFDLNDPNLRMLDLDRMES
ncbi:MAG: SpvB/TcaC N-terminal domain-containing protein [Bacteroidia bacterium]